MKTEDALSVAERQYAEAHATHYEERNLLGALRAYAQIIELHASAPEAGYARVQIRNIVGLVAPAGELLTSQIELALRHLQPPGDASATAAS